MTVDWIALVAARWLNFIAVAGLFGMALFPLYAPEPARRAYLRRPAAQILTISGGVLALVSTFGWAGAALVNMADDGAALWDRGAWSNFLFDTSFGIAWVARCTLAILTMVTIGVTRGRSGFALVALLTAALLISQAWVGHAASLAAPARWGVTLAFAFHVLGAGAWFGGLLSLTIALNDTRIAAASDPRVIEDVLTRFSSVGLAAVLAIVVGGAINSVALGATMPTTFSASDWVGVLVAKLALVTGMLMLACLNRFVLMPRLSEGEKSALPALARSVRTELTLGSLVLILTAALGTLDPSI